MFQKKERKMTGTYPIEPNASVDFTQLNALVDFFIIDDKNSLDSCGQEAIESIREALSKRKENFFDKLPTRFAKAIFTQYQRETEIMISNFIEQKQREKEGLVRELLDSMGHGGEEIIDIIEKWRKATKGLISSNDEFDTTEDAILTIKDFTMGELCVLIRHNELELKVR